MSNPRTTTVQTPESSDQDEIANLRRLLLIAETSRDEFMNANRGLVTYYADNAQQRLAQIKELAAQVINLGGTPTAVLDVMSLMKTGTNGGHNTIDFLSQKITALETQLRGANRQNFLKSSNEVNTLQSILNQTQSELKKMTAARQADLEINQIHQVTLRNTTNELNQLRLELNLKQTQLNAAKQKIVTLEATNLFQTKMNDAIVSDATTSSNRIKRQLEEASEINREQQGSIDLMNLALEERQIADAQVQAQHEATLLENQTRLQQLQTRFETCQALKTQALKDLQKVNHQLTQANTTLTEHDARISTDTLTLQDLRAETQTQQSELQKLQDKIKTLNARLANQKQKIKEQQATINKQQKSLTQLEQQLTRARNTDAANKTAISSLEEQLSRLQATEARLVSLQTQFDNLNIQLANQKITSTKRLYFSTEFKKNIDYLQSVLTLTKQTIHNLNATNSKKDIIISRLIEQGAISSRAANERQVELSQANHTVHKLNRMVSNFNLCPDMFNQISNLTDLNEELQQKCQTLEAALATQQIQSPADETNLPKRRRTASKPTLFGASPPRQPYLFSDGSFSNISVDGISGDERLEFSLHFDQQLTYNGNAISGNISASDSRDRLDSLLRYT